MNEITNREYCNILFKRKNKNTQTFRQSLNRRERYQHAKRNLRKKKKISSSKIWGGIGKMKGHKAPVTRFDRILNPFFFFLPLPRDRFAFSRVKFPFHYPPRILFSRILSAPAGNRAEKSGDEVEGRFVDCSNTNNYSSKERDEQFWKSSLILL